MFLKHTAPRPTPSIMLKKSHHPLTILPSSATATSSRVSFLPCRQYSIIHHHQLLKYHHYTHSLQNSFTTASTPAAAHNCLHYNNRSHSPCGTTAAASSLHHDASRMFHTSPLLNYDPTLLKKMPKKFKRKLRKRIYSAKKNLHPEDSFPLDEDMSIHDPDFPHASTSSILHKLHDPNLRIAIVGRPNAGKSTLFNKLLGRRHAITSPHEHTTRDVHEKPLDWRNKTTHTNHFVTLVDTPGTPENMDNIIEQTENAISTADLAFFVTSYRDGITKQDQIIADYLKKGHYKNLNHPQRQPAGGMNTTTESGLAVVHIVNKCDHMIEWDEEEWDELNEQHSIPDFGKPFAISAEHTIGFSPLKNLMEALNFRSQKLLGTDDGLIRMAIIGRANVGKSTLFNQLIGENRVLVSETPGTSRDSIELFAEFRSKAGTPEEDIRQVLLVDTAGLRRNKNLVNDRIEYEANQDALRAMRYANVVVMVIDASEGLQRKDMNILRTLEKHGRSVVLALNKWDLVEDPELMAEQIEYSINKSMKVLAGLPMVVTSAKHATNVPLLMDKVVESYDRWNTKIPTTRLNQFLKQFMASRVHIPASWPTIKFITQVATRPPTFAVFFKGASVLPAPFEKMIRNALREEFELGGLPIRIKPKPYSAAIQEKR